MEDPYYRYGGSADRGSGSRPSFPGYLSSETPSAGFNHFLGSSDLHSASSRRDHGTYGLNDGSDTGIRPEHVKTGLAGVSSGRGYPTPLEDPNLVRQNFAAVNERPRSYALNDVSGIGVHSESAVTGVTGLVGSKTYLLSPRDSAFVNQRQDAAPGISAGIPNAVDLRPSSFANADPLSAKEKSNVLFVDGLPTDCTRREVGHLFRPFIGYKDIKVVHREPRRTGARALVLCFVEFIDPKCALTAMEALQGYKFDDKKPASPALRIRFGHFPFRLPSDHDEKGTGFSG